MEAILNAEPESLSVNQLKSILFENGEFIPQVQTPKATFVQMFKDLQKKVSANPDGHWQASVLMDPPPFTPSKRKSQQQTYNFPPPPASSHPVARNRSSGFDIRTNVVSVVVPFPPSTPEQSRNASIDGLPQSPPSAKSSINANTRNNDADEHPMKPSCRLESVYYDVVRGDGSKTRMVMNTNSTIVNNFNDENNNNNDDDDDNCGGGIFMVQSPPSSDDDIISEGDNDYGNFNDNNYADDDDDDDDDNIHEHPNYGVQDSLLDRIWDKITSNFVVISIIILILGVVYNYAYLHPYDVWSKVIPNNGALSKELLLRQVSRTLTSERGADEVCGWGRTNMKMEEFIDNEKKSLIWFDVSNDDLDKHGIVYSGVVDMYSASEKKVMFPSMCFFYERCGQVCKILLCVLLFVLSKRLSRRMN